MNTRNCLFDDIYHFDSTGKFQNILGETTWLEGWQNNGTEACGKPVAPHDGMSNGTWEIDSINGSIIINGKGLYLGLPKATNTGELSNNTNVPTQRIYEAGLNANSLKTGIDYGNGYWSFEFVPTDNKNSVQNYKIDEIKFFPNPATNQIRVICSEPYFSISIRDLLGRIKIQKVLSDSQNCNISISHLPKGSYIVVIKTNKRNKKGILIVK